MATPEGRATFGGAGGPNEGQIQAYVDAQTRPLLLARATAGVWILLAAVCGFSAAKLWIEPLTSSQWIAPYLGLALIQPLALILLARAATTTHLETILVVDGMAACAVFAWGGVVAGRTTPSDFFLMSLPVFAAAIVPWRPRFQALLAGMAAAAVTANAYGVEGRLSGAVDFRTFVPAVVLLGASVYTSATLQKARRRTARADLLREEAEAARRELNALLERRVIDRTSELQATNDELEAFAYSVSHDLRAPLRAMNGLSEALLEDYSTDLDDAAKDCLHRIRVEAGRLGDLIDELLQLSRVTRSVIGRHDVNLSALAATVVENLRLGAPGRDVNFTIATGLYDHCDAALVRILLENVLGNAFKFTRGRSRAMIEFGSEQDNGSRIYFVRDNGVGFDMAHAGKIFAAFERLHGSQDFEGSGIGLTTAERIVRRHGGILTAEAAPDAGATFRFTLSPRGGGIS